MGELPSRRDDEKLVQELDEDREALEETRDPMGLGHDPEQSRTVSEIAEKRTRA